MEERARTKACRYALHNVIQGIAPHVLHCRITWRQGLHHVGLKIDTGEKSRESDPAASTFSPLGFDSFKFDREQKWVIFTILLEYALKKDEVFFFSFPILLEDKERLIFKNTI